VADGSDRFVGVDERPHEGHSPGMHAQTVRVGNAARKHKRVVVSRPNLVQASIDREMTGRCVALHRSNLAVVDGYQVQLCSGAGESRPWLGELALFDPVGRQKRDLPACDS